MHVAHLARTDLNLLVVLAALVAEQNVTRAGKRIGLTQSAMSHALARLRATIEDPVLVRVGGAMVATHRAKTLAAAVDASLASIERALFAGHFDPRTSTRTFTIGMSDYAELVLLPRLLARLREDAPGIDLWIVAVEDVGGALARGAMDLVVAPLRDRDRIAGIREEKLFDERFVCTMRRGHPLSRGRLTLARYTSASHVLVAPTGRRGSFVDEALAGLGKSRRVMLGVPHFLVVPHVLRGSDLIVTLAERVAVAYTETHDLVSVAPPVEVPGFAMSQIWHVREDADEGHAWLRSVLAEVAAEIAAAPSRRRDRAARRGRQLASRS